MENKYVSDYYRRIGMEAIETMPELLYLKASQIKIAYLCSDENKKEGRGSKPLYAETEIIPGKYKWGIEADAAITVYHPNAAALTDKQKFILIFQQLLKIGITLSSEGEERYVLNEYDVTDFRIIIDKYGTNWAETQPELIDEDFEIVEETPEQEENSKPEKQNKPPIYGGIKL